AAGGTDLNAQVIGGAAADDALTIKGIADTQTITASGDKHSYRCSGRCSSGHNYHRLEWLERNRRNFKRYYHY
ncbi:hypothetical protein RVY88_09125, partial [Campylobacter sp. TJR-1]|uniref:hypothetical protein n=1 Tax=Campylobacter sp. TJR-1 TaxID=3079310 RepID=UPI002936362B